MSSTDLSIIIVDDLQFSRIVVKTALKKAGYSGVRMADCATEALEMLDQQRADVVLADWTMPEMDGLELTQRIRQMDEENGTYTAVILLTAHEEIDYLVRAFEHGVDDYLCKPPNALELASRVNAAARIAVMQNDLLETSRQLQKTIQNLEKMSLIDELTGAGNEKFLTDNLTAQLKEASTRRAGVSLALIELRELDDIQAKHGYNVLEEIMVSQHRRLRMAVRPTDVVSRMNDNSFGIIMRHTNIGDYKPSSMNRILNIIDNRAYKTTAGNLEMTGAIGVHYFRGDEPIISADGMIKAANEKLGTAKTDVTNSIAY
jgi:diguanylate cyclase (GGDEF)-like protein